MSIKVSHHSLLLLLLLLLRDDDSCHSKTYLVALTAHSRGVSMPHTLSTALFMSVVYSHITTACSTNTQYIYTHTHTCCVFFFSSVSLSLSSSFCSTQKHIFVSLFFFAFAPYLASQANNLHLLHAHKHVSSRHSPRAAVQQHSLHSQHTTPSPASAPSPSNLTLTLKIPKLPAPLEMTFRGV